MAHGPLLSVPLRGRALMLASSLLACACTRESASSSRAELRVWAFGAEGEALAPLAREFERANPDVRVRVQQIPWTAAHEKLLTAFVGGALPDVAQLGNTWVPELAALGALRPLDTLVARDSIAVPRQDYFPGVVATNEIDGVLYGIPWYVDTRVLFYRSDLLRRAGIMEPPVTWPQLRHALTRVKKVQPPNGAPIVMPLDEWAQPVIFGLQSGATLLRDHGTRGAFEDPRFRRGFDFYAGLFRDGLAPSLSSPQVGNIYQEFAAGRIAMYITGPWNVGQFRQRLPDSLAGRWTTAPLPGPTGAGASFAGGSSLVIMRGSRRQAEAWRFIAFMSDPARQARFYTMTGDLPARRSAWDTPALARDPELAAFRAQLGRVVPTAPVPEWELIASRVAQAAERVVLGHQSQTEALADLDADVDAILEKRRWLLAQRRGSTSEAREVRQ